MSDLQQRIAGLSPDKRALLLKRLAGAGGAVAAIPVRSAPGEPAPLSFAQQRLWFLDQLEPGSPIYNLPVAVRLIGVLDRSALQRALDEVVRRHEALRTTFGVRNGEPVQVVAPPAPVPLDVLEIEDVPERERDAAALRRAAQELSRPFDLARGPLFRAVLLRPSPVEQVLLLCMHHIVSDGWSMRILAREVTALYQAHWLGRPAKLPDLPIQYSDFAVWQRAHLGAGELQRQLAYWKERLAGAPPVLALPTDRPRPAVQTYNGASLPLELPQALLGGLKELSERLGASLFMVLLAAFKVLLWRMTRQTDVVVGTLIANRNRIEIEGLIGFFVNTLVLRTDLSGDPSFEELLGRVRETALGAYAHQDVPFEKLVEELQPRRVLGHSPLFQVLFILQNPQEGAAAENAVDVPSALSKYDLTLSLTETAQGLSGTIEYNTDLFDAATIESLAARYHLLLDEATARPQARLLDLRLETAGDRRVLREWSRHPHTVPCEPLIHEMVAHQAERTPDAVAVIHGRQEVRYRALDERANRMAHLLRKRGVGPDVLVALCAPRTPELLVALLGILKAGGAYLPLDPAFPSQRLATMLSDSGAHLLLSTSGLLERLPDERPETLLLDTLDDALEAEPAARLGSVVGPSSLAWVIYTSGSTGRPKGVAVEHRGAAVLVKWAAGLLGPEALAGVLASTSLCFDPSVYEIFTPLGVGGALILARDVLELPELDAAERVTLVHTVPSALADLLSRHALPSSVRVVSLAGEALPRPLVERLRLERQVRRVLNLYGPTEDTVYSTYAEIAPGETGPPPIGRPVANTRVYILDERRQLLPAGVPGEIWVAGDGLARGYLGRPELTRERFVPDPFEPGARMYRTGDLGRFRRDGQVEFLGRADHQLKLRGYRVEPGEVEAVLLEHPLVGEAVATLREDTGDPRLVGYVTLRDEEETPALPTEGWRVLFDETYARASAEPRSDDTLAGWVRASGEPFATEELTEDAAAIASRVRALAPERVLEIGCGSGRILDLLAPHCTEYCGTDFSGEAVGRLRQRLAAAGPRLGHVRVLQREATDLGDLEAGSFDVALVNSVVQYFPDAEYLLRVLRGAARLVRPGGYLVLGDLRSLPQLPLFHASLALARSPVTPSPAELRAGIERGLAEEQELALHPAFFQGLATRLPEIVDVRVQCKRGAQDNELTRYRYDALLQVGPARRGAIPVAVVAEGSGLAELAEAARRGGVWQLGLRDGRVAAEAEAYARAGGVPLGERESLHPERVWRWAEGEGLALGCRPGAQAGCFDVRVEATSDTVARAWGPAADDAPLAHPLASLVNRPLVARRRRELLGDLRRHLRARLPEYMIPSHLVVLAELPRTGSGKLDRGALPAPALAAGEGGSRYRAPITVLEQRMAALWSEALGAPQVGLDDDFFALGGHSLLATQLVARVRQALGIELPLRRLFEAPTLQAFSAAVAEACEQQRGPAVALGPTPRGERLPLTFAQQRLFFLDQLEPGSAAYNMPTALRLRGPLDAAALEGALGAIVARHEALRTTFQAPEGRPEQVVHPPAPHPLALVDLGAVPAVEREAEALRLAADEARRPFDLAGGPLMRTTLVRLGSEEHLLLLTMHHIVSDGWSMGVLLRELMALYESLTGGPPADLPDLPVQYADFAAWQRQNLQGARLESELGYWREHLAGDLPVLALPADNPRPARPGRRGESVGLRLPADVSASLHRLAREERATMFMVVLAAFKALLARQTGLLDVLVGTPVAGRGQVELEGLVGLFVNTLVLRTDLSGRPSFRELVRRVRTYSLGAFAHQDVPFETLVEVLQPARSLARTPLFQVFFNMLGGPGRGESVPATQLRVEPLAATTPEAKFDLTLYAREDAEGLRLDLVYDANLFGGARMRDLAEQLGSLCRALATDPERPIDSVSLVTEAARPALPDPAAPLVRRVESRPLPELLAWARRAPERVAMEDAAGVWSYGQLATVSARLATRLRAAGVPRGSVVALQAPRSAALVAAVVGIWRAGAAVLVLDPAYPLLRRSQYVRLARPEALVEIGAEGAGTLGAEGHEWRLRVVAPGPSLEALAVAFGEEEEPGELPEPDELAYVAFTSGSTGEPKGVLGQHAALGHFVAWHGSTFGLNAQDRFSLLSGLGHDPLWRDMLTPLSLGATLAVPAQDDYALPGRLGEWLARAGVTVAHLTPGLLRLLSEGHEGRAWPLRYAFFGGEPLTRADVERLRRHAPGATAVNFYGTTETPQAMAFHVASEGDPDHVPVGRGIDAAQLLVLGPAGLCGVGELGEVAVRSPYLAAGYLGDERLTRLRFVANPLAGDDTRDRVYLTGDLGRYRADGGVELLGRRDDQVQVRGLRVELGEIQELLRRHPGVEDACVVLREDLPGDARLVAYVVPGPGLGDAPEACRQYLSLRLPAASLPGTYVVLERLPLTPNGKLDRRALPRPARRDEKKRPPGSELERSLAAIWSEVLGVESPGLDDSFFELGGHSLVALRVVARIRERVGVELPVRALFETPRLADLAERVATLGGGARSQEPPLRPVPRTERLPLSFAQQRLWFLDQLQPGRPAYNVPAALRVRGPLDVEALSFALDAIVARHESLRTRFVPEEGQPWQVIDAAAPVPLPVEDVRALGEDERLLAAKRRADSEAARPFDLQRGPLVRARLIRLADEEHLLLWTVHHIASDGWSFGVFLRELQEHYEARRQGRPTRLAPLAVQYADVAAWQRERLAELLEAGLTYWRRQLEGAPALLELPTDRPRPVLSSGQGAVGTRLVPRALRQRVEALAHASGATPFMAWLAAYQLLLARLSGQTDVVVGTPIAGRLRPEMEPLIGFFANTLVLRTDLGGRPSFRDLLVRVRETVLGAFGHQDMPFERLVEELRPERQLGHAPLFQTMFVQQPPVGDGVRLGDAEVGGWPVSNGTARFDLTLTVGDVEAGLLVSAEYSTDLFSAGSVARWLATFEELLERVSAEPDRPVGELDFMPGAEAQQVRAAARGPWRPRAERSFDELFEARVAERPKATAVASGARSLTYRELSDASRAMACRLAAAGVGPGSLVGIAAPPGPERVMAMLAVWKAGAPYLPLEPQDPLGRLRDLIDDARPDLILAEAALGARLGDTPVMAFVEREASSDGKPSPPSRSSGERLGQERPETAVAYVIYTSGSTGRPKGVELTHRGLVNMALSQRELLGVGPADRVLQFASFGFDASVAEVALALCSGATLVVAPAGGERQPGTPLHGLLRREAITVVTLPPSALSVLSDKDLPALTTVLAAGEACPADVARRWSRGRRFFNAYGPTETTVCATLWEHDGTPGQPPIGRALPNTAAWVVDAAGRPAPFGVAGELCLAGVQVGLGYRGRPELTAERFVALDALPEEGRVYRTGDRARLRPDGQLEFLGRLDDQVKVRGHRIEPGEVEAALRSFGGATDAAVVVRGTGPSARLVAFLQTDALPERSELDAHCRARLPEFMCPSELRALASLPRTSTGKLDRRALTALAASAPDETRRGSAPVTPVQRELAGLWSALLGTKDLGLEDDFFARGGHSLLATQLVSRLREAFGVDVPLQQVFATPTLAGLAEAVEREQLAGRRAAPKIVPAARDRALPLSFAQQRLWFLDQLHPGSAAYNMPFAFHLRGRLRREDLRWALGEIVGRHEALRTRFVAGPEGPCQVVDAPANLALPFVTLAHLEAQPRQAELQRLALEEAKAPFDLARGPALRCRLVELGAEEHVLLLTLHHAVADGWSMGVLLRELAVLYEAHGRATLAALPALPVQYADFAVWQREWLSGEVLQAQLDYWRLRLRGATPLELPSDRPRRPHVESRGEKLALLLPGALVERLQDLGRQQGASLFMTLLAAFDLLLSRHSGQTDVVVGAPIANRTRSEIEGLIGFFVNTLVLRTDLGGDPTFTELLGRVRETALEAYAHQDLPFERIVEELQPERDLSHSPLFRVTFALQNAPLEALRLPELEVSALAVPTGTAKFDLGLSLQPSPEGLLVVAEYDALLFDRERVERLLGHYQRALEQVVADPDLRVSEVPLVGLEEQARLRACSRGPVIHAVERGSTPARVARRAQEQPGAIAVQNGPDVLTYAELEERASRMARGLQRRGVRRGDRVAVCAERSLEAVVGLLAVWKAGAAYVPLDPDYPRARLGHMLADCGASLLLSQRHVHGRLPATGAEALWLDAPDWWAGESAAPLGDEVTAADLAYVIYTSGSSGRPKGVLVPHGGLANLVDWHLQEYAVGSEDRATLVAGPGFDAAVWELWPALAAGASVHVAPDDARLVPAALVRWLVEQQITLAFLPTPLLEAILGEPWPPAVRLRALLTGGDRLHVRPPAGLPFRLVNHYGPTECTVVTTAGAVEAGGAGLPPIGRPIANTITHVLDEHRQPVPLGVPGELWIGGAGLAQGYLGQEELTAERFPTLSVWGEEQRLYRSGDRVRWRGDGQLEFLGRLDEQVKLRGYRVEPGEIEAQLREHPEVNEALVVVREEAPGDRRLVAYVTPRDAAGAASLGDDHVGEWRSLFDATYATAEPEDPAFNVVGWDSSTTGRPLPAEEMRVWANGTLERIRERGPRRVLEIGCGTGLLLLGLAPDCEVYCGTDFSPAALGPLAAEVDRRGLTQVRLLHRGAEDFTGFGPGEFDAVVLNSVVQYFPSVDYLLGVLEGAARVVRPGGFVFVGDVRSYPLLPAFHLAVALARGASALEVGALRQRVAQGLAQETELALDPRLFRALPDRVPSLSVAAIQQRRGTAHNELTQFRYDVVLTVDGAGPRREIPAVDWVDGQTDVPAVQRLLAAFGDEALMLRGVPNSRVQREVLALGWLRDEDVRNAAELRARMTAADAGVDPESLWALEASGEWSVQVGWARDGRPERMDVTFLRRSPAWPQGRPVAEPVVPAPTSWSTLANAPLQERLAGRLAPELKRFLEERLPDFMVPRAFVVLRALPLTPNGKPDRAALPVPEGCEVGPRRRYVAPRTELEQVVAGVFCDALQLESVGVHDDFFDLGGHSLLATRVVTRLRDVLQVELPVRSLFEAPTVALLAARVETAGGARPGGPELRPVERGQDLPLSFAQERLYFLDRLEGGSATYNVPFAVHMAGPLEREALAAALGDLLSRHEVLRTVFVSASGEPRQRVVPPGSLPLPLEDLADRAADDREAALRRHLSDEARQPFDLEAGPLVRARLLRLGAREHVLLLSLHHIVCDGWSLGVLVRDLAELYEARVERRPPALPELPVQYADFAVWQRDWLSGSELTRQTEYWKRQLAGPLPVLDLPADRPRPAQQTFRGARLAFALPAELSERLKALSRREGASLFMTLLAAFEALLARTTGEADVRVGTPVANRTRSEVEGLIGFFVNTLVLRTDLSGDPSFREALGRVRQTALGAYAHQDVPFEKLVEALQPARDPSRPPLFQVLFALHNAPRAEWTLKDLRLLPLPVESGTAKFDLSLALAETEAGLQGSLEYNTDLFDAERMQRLLVRYERLLEAAGAEPERRLSELPLLSEAEERSLLALGTGTRTEAPPEAWLELVARQASSRPTALAAIDGPRALTYVELLEQAHRVARALVALGVGPGARVVLALPRSVEALAAVLGILEVGAAYVPVDPALPQARLDLILTECAPAAVVAPAQDVRWAQAPVLTWSDLPAAAGSVPPAAPWGPDAPLYVLYTSGSTGRPKGVVQRHGALQNLIRWQCRESAVGAGGRTLQFAALGFDVSFQELFATWCARGTLVLAPEPARHDAALLWRTLCDERIERLFLPYAALQVLAEAAHGEAEMPAHLREVITAGEALHVTRAVSELFQRLPECRLVNQYGPTETHVVTAHVLEGAPSRWEALPPIGRPIDNARVYVVDGHGRPVPEGVTGEIVVGGVPVALGYLAQAELTAQRFVADELSGDGGRAYRTGDLGRWHADGTLEFLGRLDDQVKVRGYRIEPGEIEVALGSHPGVVEAAVVARGADAAQRRLVAYVVTRGPLPDEALHEHLRQRLPEPLRPSLFVRLEALPRTASGKLDRRALPDLHRATRSGSPDPPRDALEARLCRIFEEVLGAPAGRSDGFFDLGGHSLLALRVVARVEEELRLRVPVAALFQAPTVAALAERLRAEAPPRLSPLVPLRRAGTARPLFFVHAGGGAAASYAPLARLLPADRPVYAFEAPGLAPGERPMTDLGALATAYLAELRTVQPHGPFLLGGWSFGGLVAFEMARQIEGMGEQVAGVVLIDSALPRPGKNVPARPRSGPSTMSDEGFTPEERTTRAQLWWLLARDLGLGPEALPPAALATSDEAAAAALLAAGIAAGVLPPSLEVEHVLRRANVLEGSLVAAAAYRSGPLEAPVALLRAAEGALGSQEVEAWRRLALRLDERSVPGEHFALLREPWVADVAQEIQTVLEDIDRT